MPRRDSRRFLIVSEVPLHTLAAEPRQLIKHYNPGIPHCTMDTLHLPAGLHTLPV